MPIEVERAAPFVERRKAERRGMDALRAEALQTLITKVEDKNFGGLRDRIHWARRIPMKRLVLVVVALLAGGTAAYLATQHEPAVVVAPVEPAKAPTTQILVAKLAIGIGQRLSPATLAWEDWPEAAVRPEYITVSASPAAMTDMAGSMARTDFVEGEPIRAQKLAPAGQGFLSAILSDGMRGVSVSIGAESASGGFVVPNDHVDVVLTRASELGGQESQTILSDVRVLAINAKLGAIGNGDKSASAEAADPATQVFENQAIATLELNPTQAELIINAGQTGKLTLMLRPIGSKTDAAAAAERATNAAIRLASPFWKK